MILTVLHWFGGLLVLVTMWAAVQFDGRPLEPGSVFDRRTPPEQTSSRTRCHERVAEAGLKGSGRLLSGLVAGRAAVGTDHQT
jgi:hypothetical protein